MIKDLTTVKRVYIALLPYVKLRCYLKLISLLNAVIINLSFGGSFSFCTFQNTWFTHYIYYS